MKSYSIAIVLVLCLFTQNVFSQATSTVVTTVSTNQGANANGDNNVVGQSGTTTSITSTTPVNVVVSDGSARVLQATSNIASDIATNQNANIVGNNNVVGQSATTLSRINSTPVNIAGLLGRVLQATSNVNANVATNQNANTNGDNNVIGQSGTTASLITATPVNIVIPGVPGRVLQSLSDIVSNIATNQNANIVGDNNVVGQSATTLSRIDSTPVNIAGLGTFGRVLQATSTVTSNVATNQDANTNGDNNVIGQSGTTASVISSTPVDIVIPGVPARVLQATSNVAATVTSNQNAAPTGDNNVIGQSATTASQIASTPVNIVIPGLPTRVLQATSNVVSNIATNQNANINGNNNVVGQSATTASRIDSTPVNINGFFGRVLQSISDIVSNIATNQNANIVGNNNVVGQSATTSSQITATPVNIIGFTRLLRGCVGCDKE